MTRLAILFAVLAALSDGCGGHSRPSPVVAAGCGLSSPSELRVREVRVAGTPVPIEGEISYVRVRRVGGTVIADTVLPSGHAFRCRVAAGRYAVAVWHRVCSANCGNLESVSDRCQRVVEVPESVTVRVTVRNRLFSPCRVIVMRHG